MGQIPLDVRKTLNLSSDQKGVDGAFRTRTGTLVPYQVKHRIGRPKVGVAEVATFLGLTERATDRVLISNATRYATDVENRDHLRLITGTNFDTLTATDLQGIAAWLDGRPAPPTRKRLGQWLGDLRTKKRKGTLSAERITRLEALGVWWSKPRTP